MDVSSTSATAGLATGATTDNPVSVVMLKKAIQIEQQSAKALIDSLPQPAPVVDPNATLGRNIDVKA